MTRFRALLYCSALLVIFALTIAVQPSIGQQEHAKHIFHRLIPAGNTCATCHKAVYDQWKASPHAANGVECTVCHGETTAPDFAGTPGLSTCDSCHSDQVAQLKSDPFMKGRTCVNCHQAHIFVEHKKAATATK
jgi:hypothetical protein